MDFNSQLDKFLGPDEEQGPQVAYRQLGDGSWSARVTDGGEVVGVHTNRNRAALQKLVWERYKVR